jgi:type I restriction enzyme M protein
MTKLDNNNTVFMENVERGIKEKIIKLSGDDKRITYFCKQEYSTTFTNPEEKVRASYFVELVLDKKYFEEDIDIEVKVERRIKKIMGVVEDGR